MEVNMSNKEFVNIERRKLDYLLNRAKCNIDDVNTLFEKFDIKMNKFKPNETVYIENGFYDGYFVMTTIEIMDKNTGTVKLKHQGIKNDERIVNILDIYFEDEKRPVCY